MPGVLGVTVVTMLVCFFHLHARPRVLSERPAFPAPSDSWAGRYGKNSRGIRGEIAKVWVQTMVLYGNPNQFRDSTQVVIAGLDPAKTA